MTMPDLEEGWFIVFLAIAIGLGFGIGALINVIRELF